MLLHSTPRFDGRLLKMGKSRRDAKKRQGNPKAVFISWRLSLSPDLLQRRAS